MLGLNYGDRGQLLRVSSLLLHVCSGDHTQVIRLGCWHLYHLSHLAGHYVSPNSDVSI